MKKLRCSNCGNNKTWRNITIKQGVSKAECNVCGHIEESTKGIYVDTVVGQMTMEM